MKDLLRLSKKKDIVYFSSLSVWFRIINVVTIFRFKVSFSTFCNKKLCPGIHYDFQDQFQIHHCYYLLQYLALLGVEYENFWGWLFYLMVEYEQIVLGILKWCQSNHNLCLRTKLYTVFPHIVSAETILFWIWKCKGHSI